MKSAVKLPGAKIQQERRKIRLIVGKAKCCHLKILACIETLWQVFIRVYILYRLKKANFFVYSQSVMLVFLTQLCELLPL